MKYRKITAGFIFIIGLALVCYPMLAKYINNKNASRIADDYNELFSNLSEEEKQEFLDELQSYGNANSDYDNSSEDTYAQMSGAGGSEGKKDYGTDVFATILIPRLGLNLPVYLGATAANLSRGIAHIEGTSLPLGGASTHCVLAGHSGYANNEWFSNIDKLQEGDFFYITNISEEMTYKIIQIQIIEPYDTSKLLIEKDKDLTSLLTCMTPGVPNNKRLLVTGERTAD